MQEHQRPAQSQQRWAGCRVLGFRGWGKEGSWQRQSCPLLTYILEVAVLRHRAGKQSQGSACEGHCRRSLPGSDVGGGWVSLEQGRWLMVPALPPGALPVAGAGGRAPASSSCCPSAHSSQRPTSQPGRAGLLYFSEGGQRGSTAMWPPVSVKEI